jgi:hypothetical protein
MGGGEADREKKIKFGLAFFPVVAISSNLSTSIQGTKQTKIFVKTKSSSFGEVSEDLFQIALIFLK